MTTPDHFKRVDELFRRACALPSAQRPALLDRDCGGDPALRDEVDALLAADDRSARFLEDPIVAFSDAAPADARPRAADDRPQRIAGYSIKRVIGEGGMGVVFEAEQQNPRRIVALKVIRPELVSASTLRRFEHEAEVLGRLQHPGIAHIHEAGADGTRLFFAMELVRGTPLLAFASQRPLRQKLLLFARICDAVQHAHANAVIHRDLKPGNILVVDDADAGQPKVLDFGVARAVNTDRAAVSMHTRAGQIVGTISYMSPEQAAGDSNAIDTRSDVFSLGVILFELICGHLPYDFERKSDFEAIGMIREKEPARLRTIDRRYRGDLDTIVAKALEKDPPRRYQTAAELAADVRRFLNDEAIQARPATTLYHLAKFARRNKVAVTAAAIVLVSLVAALIVTSTSLRRTSLALTRAERQTKIAEAVQSFMNEDLIGAADADRLGQTATIREAIDAAAARVDDKFKTEPVVAAAVHASVGNIYWSLGELESGERHLLKAKELFDRHVAPGDEIRLYVLNDLAKFYLDQYAPDPAEPLLRESIPLCRETFGPEAKETLRAECDLARVYMTRSDFDRAEPELLALLPRVTRAEGEQSRTAAMVMSRLGALYLESDRPEKAEPMFTRALAADRSLYGPDHSITLSAINNLAVTYEKLGRLDEAAAMHEESVERLEQLNGRSHPETLPAIYNLAMVYYRQDRFRQAEQLLIEVLEQCRSVFGDEHVGTIRTIGTLADVYAAMKNYDRAEPLMREAADLSARAFGADHPEAVQSRQALDQLRKARDGVP